jgi:hypothetical protein
MSYLVKFFSIIFHDPQTQEVINNDIRMYSNVLSCSGNVFLIYRTH